ncbi:hypothetical protein HYC85_009050 [Camellia sinensis]|uniref:Uncharacterized protein n=1 Tax=Camellia sinensis TaxID=4442 RepID=A0A7J7HVU4_CAMSI|nr:hypothetical protein HYC85_009050 [Camellia sinensis]
MVVCWILGLGCLISWSSMLTIGDYYYDQFPRYHPARVPTLVYQPFALGTTAILAHNESKVDTRRRNLTGYILFFISSLALLVVSTAMTPLCLIQRVEEEEEKGIKNEETEKENLDGSTSGYPLVYMEASK